MPGHSLSEPTESFGSYLRFLRRRARLTQAALSVAVGYSPGQISMLENGQRSPDVTAVMALFIDALGLREDRQSTATLIQLAQTAAVRAQAERAEHNGRTPPQTSLHQTITWQEEVLGNLEDIPPLPSCFVERTRASEQIARWLRHEHRAAVCGLPGMGKSTLAAAFAHEYAQQHPVFWFTFDEEGNQTTEDLLRQLALFGLAVGAHGAYAPVLRRIATDAAPGPLRQQIVAVATALHACRAPLLVFDDVQYAASASTWMAVIGKLAIGAPYCRMLFVTRETLELTGTPHLMLGGLERAEALALFQALQTPADALPAIDADSHRDVFEQVLVHTAGNPLLLRLAASRLEQPSRLPPAVLGAQLANRLVAALLAWLSPSARRVLDLLTVVRTTVNLDDPALTAALRHEDADYDHLGAVSQLLRGHLIEHRAHAGLHPLLREPLFADLQERPVDGRSAHQAAATWAAARRDFIAATHHYVQMGDLAAACDVLAGDWIEQLSAGETPAAVAAIDEAVAAIRRTLPAAAQRPAVGLLLARRGDLLINTPRAAEARVDYRTAIEATDELLPRLQLAYRLANSLLQVGQARDALQLCTDAARQLTLVEDGAVALIRAQLDSVRTRALLGIGQLAEAALCCEQAIETARSLRLANPTLAEKICTDAYRGLGYIARRQGRNAEARPYFVRAVSHARAAGLSKEEAETLGYLSATLRDLGDFAGALQHGEQALVVAQKAGNDYLAANLLHYLSITCYYHDQLTQALTYSQQAALLHQAMGDSEGMVSCDILQAVVYAALGPLSAAVAAIDRARSDSELFDNRWLQGMALYVYGIVHTFAGNLPAAAEALERALTLPAFTQDLPAAASTRLFLGINHVAQGKLAQAQEILQQLPAPSAIEVELLAGLFRGMVHLAAGDPAAALAVAADTRRRGQASGHLIYAAEAGRLSLACVTAVPLADLPAFVCCEIRSGLSRS